MTSGVLRSSFSVTRGAVSLCDENDTVMALIRGAIYGMSHASLNCFGKSYLKLSLSKSLCAFRNNIQAACLGIAHSGWRGHK